MKRDPGDILDALIQQRGGAAAVAAPDGVLLVSGADIRPEPVRWLWPGWLALGKLHILAGAPGMGKTTLALAVASTITSGGRWPDGSRCERASVLIWSGEDDPSDTLLPRLLAMGADATRVHFVTGTRIAGEALPFDPARDLVQLTLAAERIGDVRLLVVDPVVSAVLGDSHKNAEVRRGLQPVVDLAAALDCAAVGISHFTKGSAGRDPAERVIGSVAFAAVSRIVLVAAKVKDDDGDDRRILARAKSNIGPDDGAFHYEFEQVELAAHPGVTASRILWGAAVQGTARDLLAEPEQDADAESALLDAIEYLRTELAAGATPTKDIQKAAGAAGHAWRTVERAKRRLGVKSSKETDGWVWSLPSGKAASKAATEILGGVGGVGGVGRVEAVKAAKTAKAANFHDGGLDGGLDPDPGEDFIGPPDLRRTARELVARMATYRGWTDSEREAWIADADTDPAAVLDCLAD